MTDPATCPACGAPLDDTGHLPHESCADPEAGQWVVMAHCATCATTGSGICNGGNPWLVGSTLKGRGPLRMDPPRAQRLARLLNGIRSGPMATSLAGHGQARVYRALPFASPECLGLPVRPSGGGFEPPADF